MIHYYAFKNFQSFEDFTLVSLIQSDKAPPRRWCVTSESGAKVSTALAVFGPNAAGKTALLKVLAFASWFAFESFYHDPERAIPLTGHFASKDDPSEFEIEFESNGEIWRYELKATTERVLHEALYKKKSRFSYVFIRDWDSVLNAYNIRQNAFGLKPSEALKVRQNASLISTAAQYNVDLGFDRWVASTNIWVRGRRKFDPAAVDEATQRYAHEANSNIQKKMINLLKRWDLGLSGLKFVEDKDIEQSSRSRRGVSAFGLHQVDGVDYELPLYLESSGTQAAYVLMFHILYALQHGGVALLDEMESDLHPQLLSPILELFDSVESNPHNAQLVFTCHAQQVLDIVQKNQVMFVEKNDCRSEAYRASEIKGLRADDNLRSKYATGALGAIPRV